MLDQLQWPVRYLDFEAVMPHLLWFAGTAPYETVPFQYSRHVLDARDPEARHLEFLAETEGDWRLLMTETLLHDLGTAGSIVVYSGYEKGAAEGAGTDVPAARGADQRRAGAVV